MNWAIVSRDTGNVVAETFTTEMTDLYRNDGTWEVLPILDWLRRFNRLVKAAGGIQPSPEALKAAVAS